jgi:hypothetical protein
MGRNQDLYNLHYDSTVGENIKSSDFHKRIKYIFPVNVENEYCQLCRLPETEQHVKYKSQALLF